MNSLALLLGLALTVWLVGTLGWTGALVQVIELRMLAAVLRLLFGR